MTLDKCEADLIAWAQKEYPQPAGRWSSATVSAGMSLVDAYLDCGDDPAVLAEVADALAASQGADGAAVNAARWREHADSLRRCPPP